MTDRITRYEDFWPFYLKEHSRADTRRLHYIGTGCGLVLLLVGLLLQVRSLILLALISGYGFAWYAHFKLEGNKPATFRYPMWSFASDVRMLYLYLNGQLDAEMNKYGITDQSR